MAASSAIGGAGIDITSCEAESPVADIEAKLSTFRFIGLLLVLPSFDQLAAEVMSRLRFGDVRPTVGLGTAIVLPGRNCRTPELLGWDEWFPSLVLSDILEIGSGASLEFCLDNKVGEDESPLCPTQAVHSIGANIIAMALSIGRMRTKSAELSSYVAGTKSEYRSSLSCILFALRCSLASLSLISILQIGTPRAK